MEGQGIGWRRRAKEGAGVGRWGIGVLAVEVVGEIEVDLAPRVSQDETFVLEHCLEYIATPRTGAFVAAGLARPTRIDELRSMRATHGAQLFDRRRSSAD
jgi:hypothetical protein